MTTNSRTVTAAVLRAGDAPFTVEELELDGPGAHEVLVRIVAAGMCHTDLLSRELPPEFFAGPTVYGHEGAGVVEAIGTDVTAVAVGDHVVLSFNSCGDCPACNTGRLPYCFNFAAQNMSGGRQDGTSAFTDADGGRVNSHFFGQSSFASHTIAAETSCVRVDPTLDLARLGPLGCGIQTGAGAILNTLGVEAGASVVIAGAGALGLSAVMAARVAGAGTIVAIDRHASRLELAEHFGATATLSAPPDQLTAAIQHATGGGSNYAFDTTGNALVVRALYEGLDNLGTLGMAGVGFGDMTFDFLSMIGGRTITGVMEGDSTPREFIPRLAQLNADGRFPYHELITEFPIDAVNDAEAASADGSVIKPVLRF
jgi:aryl-alcohol dehydrogenase